MVANFGTITTGQIVQQGAVLRGIALDTGGGDDRVVLGAHSTTTGDILLGTGNDTLMFLGSAVVAGAIDPGTGSNSLVFDGFGRLDLPFNGFDSATKQGAGTFTLAGLPTMHRVDVTQGTLHLESSYAMAGDSLFRAVINGNGSHGQLAVEGTATLDGTLSVSKGPGFFFNGMTFDILTADSVQDCFSSVQLPASKKLLRFGLRQSDERVQVVTQALPFSAAASNPVELAIADYLDRIVHGASGDLSDLLIEIQNLEDAEFSPAFRSLSPASYGALTDASRIGARQNVQSVQQRMAVVRTHNLAAGAPSKSEPALLASIGPYNYRRLFATAAEAENRSKQDLWMSGMAQRGSQDDRSGYPGYDFDIAAGIIGYDHTFPSRITLGAAVSKGTADVDLAGDAGEGTVESLAGILYGSYFSGAGYVEGALSSGRNEYENSRSLTIGPIRRTARSEHDGDAYAAYLGGGYFLQAGDWLVGPTAALRYVHLDEERFAERGAGSVNLMLDDRQTDSLAAELNLRATTAVKTSWGALIPEMSAGIGYDFDLDDRAIVAAFEGASGTAFSIEDRDTEQLGAVVGCGLTLLGDNGLSTSVEYRGEYRGDFRSHGVMGTLRFSF